jgi:hypothetical protein
MAGTMASSPKKATPAASKVAWSAFASAAVRASTSFHPRAGISVGELA